MSDCTPLCSCGSELSENDLEFGYATCEMCRNVGLTPTDYGLEPIIDGDQP